LVLLYGLMASGQIRLRRIDGWRDLPRVMATPVVLEMPMQMVAA